MGNSQSVDITTQKADQDGSENQKIETNGHAIPNLDLADAVPCKVSVQQKSEPSPVTDTSKTKSKPKSVVSNNTQDSATAVSLKATDDATTISFEQKVEAEATNTAKEETPKPAEKSNMFNKMFRKKDLVSSAPETNEPAKDQIVPAIQAECQKSRIYSYHKNENISECKPSGNIDIGTGSDQPQKDISPQAGIMSSEPPDIKAVPQAVKEPQGELCKPSTTEDTPDSTPPAETNEEENSVMNFFKTFKVTPTKTKVAANPDVSKEQIQKETPPAQATNVQEAAKMPPPPPAPPKNESKAEPAVKKEETLAAAAPAAQEQEISSKAKTKESSFGKFFRPKSVVKEEAKPVEVQVDASKTSTLEATAKPVPPPAPKQEETKPVKKPSPFANLLKPKVLLGQVTSKIQAAASTATAGISFGVGGGATESKKGHTAPAVAPAAASSTKVKEEPKPAAAAPAPTAAASPDNKSVGSADNPSPSMPHKLEKRNSIHLFFKNLGQKRHSDAGVQTEVPVAPEKTK